MQTTMQALSKHRAEPGIWLVSAPVPAARDQRGAGEDSRHRHLRYRPAHLQLGRLGAAQHPRAAHYRARVRRAKSPPSVMASAALPSATASPPRGMSPAACAATAAPANVTSVTWLSASAAAATAPSPSTWWCPRPTCGRCTRTSLRQPPLSWTRSATPCTPRCLST